MIYEKGKSGFFRCTATNEIGDGWGAYDNGLSNAYLVLKARAMGFDTLIMGMRDSDAIRACLDIPENETIMAVIALGYRTREPGRPQRRPFCRVCSQKAPVADSGADTAAIFRKKADFLAVWAVKSAL